MLIEASDERIVLADCMHPSRPLAVGGEIVMADGYWAVWFLYKEQPWDIARFYAPDGSFTGYYVDVLQPLHWSGDDASTLQPLVDLFLDIWITPDRQTMVLDEDEFAEAVAAGHVSAEQENLATKVLGDLLERTRQGRFPPDDVAEFSL